MIGGAKLHNLQNLRPEQKQYPEHIPRIYALGNYRRPRKAPPAQTIGELSVFFGVFYLIFSVFKKKESKDNNISPLR